MRVEKRGEGLVETPCFFAFFVWKMNEFEVFCCFLTIEAFVVCRLFFGIITFDNSPRLFGHVSIFFIHVHHIYSFLSHYLS